MPVRAGHKQISDLPHGITSTLWNATVVDVTNDLVWNYRRHISIAATAHLT